MIKVYLAKKPTFKGQKTKSVARNKELASIKNPKVFNEKLQVWLLLEYALKDSGFDPQNLQFEKLPSGKWTASGVNFSLSHSEGFFAVALSDEIVGVDLQKAVRIDSERLCQMILNESEFKKFANLPKRDKNAAAIKKWCEKESAFKMVNASGVSFKNLGDYNYFTQFETFTENGEDFYLAVTSPKKDKVQFIRVETFD